MINNENLQLDIESVFFNMLHNKEAPEDVLVEQNIYGIEYSNNSGGKVYFYSFLDDYENIVTNKTHTTFLVVIDLEKLGQYKTHNDTNNMSDFQIIEKMRSNNEDGVYFYDTLYKIKKIKEGTKTTFNGLDKETINGISEKNLRAVMYIVNNKIFE